MNDKVKELSDDNLIKLLQDGKDESLVHRPVNSACLDELIDRFWKLKNPLITIPKTPESKCPQCGTRGRGCNEHRIFREEKK